jgi:hypothetical protein
MAPQCTQVPAAHIEPSVQLFPVQQARPCVPQVMVSVPPPSVRSPPVPSVVASGRASVPASAHGPATLPIVRVAMVLRV